MILLLRMFAFANPARVKFHSKDWLDSSLLRCYFELDVRRHIAVLGHCYCRHTEFDCPIDVSLRQLKAIAIAESRMMMKAHPVHGLEIPIAAAGNTYGCLMIMTSRL